MDRCILSGFWYVPKSRIANLDAVKNDLTIQPVWFDKTEPKPLAVPNYHETADYLGMPIYYGMTKFPDDDYEDQTSSGQEMVTTKRPDPDHPNAAPNQKDFMDGLVNHFQKEHVGMALAPTGAGKTLCGLHMAAEMGRSTLVIVDREFIGVKQWIPAAKQFIGIIDEQVGMIQGDKCEYHKPFCIGMAQSLSQRDYPEELYDAFGTVIWDEAHRFSAYRMSETLGLFRAETKLALTAHAKRKDNTQRVYLDYFGPGQIKATSEALPCQVKVVPYRTANPPKGKHHIRIAALTRDTERNRLIVCQVIELYNQGRNVLVIGDNIKHLQRIEELCWKQGVPENHTGQFSRTRYIYVTEPRVIKGKKVQVKLQKTATMNNDYLEWVKDNAKIIFTTYGMGKEGLDIPRLDGGIDITPRTEGLQVIGRIRRPYPGKQTPLWVTIKDESSPELMRYYADRMKDYRKTENIEVIE